ncbi:hypothetical protein [Micropruina sp.]|uniref:hypothetical protein n=1 Tax=Micropruina sp. TaxID=2737536 RepID=UPI0039E510EC
MNRIQTAVAVIVAATGVVIGAVSAMWLTGTFGIGRQTAKAIANAVDAGSWAMFLVAIAATGGIVGAGLWGVLKLIAWRAGKAAVIA